MPERVVTFSSDFELEITCTPNSQFCVASRLTCLTPQTVYVYEVHLLIVVSPDTEVTDGVTFSSECLVHRQKFSDRFWS